MSNEPNNLIPVIVERENAVLPDWCDSWGIKSVQPDLRTYGGYQWPYPGQTATCDPDRLVPENTRVRPSQSGDGLCVATSWRGMASGGFPARTMLLVAYASDEVLGRKDAVGKVRVPRVAVVALVDGQRLLKEAGSGASLSGAYLSGASLSGASLYGANLDSANLIGADLIGADLTRANLTRANLYRAYLDSANLTDANLTGVILNRALLVGADLSGADLTGAILTGADLSGTNLTRADLTCAYLADADLTRAYLADADLYGADLYDANLRGANLRGANLRGADLHGANLRGVKHDETTTWPAGYKPMTS